jgi:hypoxanthine phosphoribosyltransferase
VKKILDCELISWKQACQLSRQLALMIREAGFRPEVVVAIARGGYVPARILCDFMDIGNLTSIRIKHYTSVRKQRCRLCSPLCVDVKGMKVLLVDDVGDTGDTLALALKHIKSFNPAQVNTAILHHKKISKIEPDFYARKIFKWRWIIYPWAVMEDISGIIRDMKNPPSSIEGATQRLKKENGIKVPKQVLEDVLALRT